MSRSSSPSHETNIYLRDDRLPLSYARLFSRLLRVISRTNSPCFTEIDFWNFPRSSITCRSCIWCSHTSAQQVQSIFAFNHSVGRTRVASSLALARSGEHPSTSPWVYPTKGYLQLLRRSWITVVCVMSDSNLSTRALMRQYAVIGRLAACQSSNRYQRGIDIIHRDDSFRRYSPVPKSFRSHRFEQGCSFKFLGIDISLYSPFSTLYFAAAFTPIDVADPDGLEYSVQCNHYNALPQTLALMMSHILFTIFQAIKRT